MSSGSRWSSLFSFVFFLLLFAAIVPGRLIPAPFVTGVKRSLEISLRLSGSRGVRKSILNASFFSRRAFGLVAAFTSSAVIIVHLVDYDRLEKKNSTHVFEPPSVTSNVLDPPNS